MGRGGETKRSVWYPRFEHESYSWSEQSSLVSVYMDEFVNSHYAVSIVRHLTTNPWN
jgi:hypothetical protein